MKIYAWFWYHTQFWLVRKRDRRPYTFIMRDWIFRHIPAFVLAVIAFYAGMIILSFWHGTVATITGSLVSLLIAHLVWGSAWVEGQQEHPEYNPNGIKGQKGK